MNKNQTLMEIFKQREEEDYDEEEEIVEVDNMMTLAGWGIRAGKDDMLFAEAKFLSGGECAADFKKYNETLVHKRREIVSANLNFVRFLISLKSLHYQ